MLVSVPFFTKYVKEPPDCTPPYTKRNFHFFSCFKDCRGAIDGSHFDLYVPDGAVAGYRNRAVFHRMYVSDAKLGRPALTDCSMWLTLHDKPTQKNEKEKKAQCDTSRVACYLKLGGPGRGASKPAFPGKLGTMVLGEHNASKHPARKIQIIMNVA